jgi:large-conductance mechanosensitive channel
MPKNSHDEERPNRAGGFIIAVVSLLCLALNVWFIVSVIRWISKKASEKKPPLK